MRHQQIGILQALGKGEIAMNQALPKRAQFQHMKDGTREDWEIIGELEFFSSGAQYVGVSRNIFCS